MAFQQTCSKFRMLYHGLKYPHNLWSGPFLSLWAHFLPLSSSVLLFQPPWPTFCSSVLPSSFPPWPLCQVCSPHRSSRGFLFHSSRSPSNVTFLLGPFIWSDTPSPCYSPFSNFIFLWCCSLLLDIMLNIFLFMCRFSLFPLEYKSLRTATFICLLLYTNA